MTRRTVTDDDVLHSIGELRTHIEDLEPDDVVEAGAAPASSRAPRPGAIAGAGALLLVVLAFVLGPLTLLATSSCTLTPAEVATVEAVNVGLCDGLEAIPIIGEVAALACPKEEAGLKGILDADVAAHPPASALPPAAGSPVTKRKLVTRPGPTPTSPRVLVGLVPAHRAARCTAAYNARATAPPAADAAPPDARSYPAVPATSLVPWPDAGQTLEELRLSDLVDAERARSHQLFDMLQAERAKHADGGR